MTDEETLRAELAQRQDLTPPPHECRWLEPGQRIMGECCVRALLAEAKADRAKLAAQMRAKAVRHCHKDQAEWCDGCACVKAWAQAADMVEGRT